MNLLTISQTACTQMKILAYKKLKFELKNILDFCVVKQFLFKLKTNKNPRNRSYYISFFVLKYLLKYNTCHTARPSSTKIENIEKYITLLLVDSKQIKNIFFRVS